MCFRFLIGILTHLHLVITLELCYYIFFSTRFVFLCWHVASLTEFLSECFCMSQCSFIGSLFFSCGYKFSCSSFLTITRMNYFSSSSSFSRSTQKRITCSSKCHQFLSHSHSLALCLVRCNHIHAFGESLSVYFPFC